MARSVSTQRRGLGQGDRCSQLKRCPVWAAWHSLSFLNMPIPVIVNYLLEALRRCLTWPGREFVATFFLSAVAGLVKSLPHALHEPGSHLLPGALI